MTPEGSSEEDEQEMLTNKRQTMKLQSAKLFNGSRKPPQPAKVVM